MGWIVVVFWVAVPLLIVSGIVWSIVAEQKRKQAMEQAATQLGLAFSEKLSDEDQGLFQNFAIAQLGHSRSATNAITADSGELRMVIFDYVYTSGSGKNKSTHRQNIVMCSSPMLKLPQFSIAPESFFHRIADFLGYKDIDFDEDEPFSRQFLLKGPDEAAVRELFNAQRRAAFMKFTDVTIEGSGHTFIFYQPRKRRDVEHLRELMESGFSVFGVLSNMQPD